MNERNAIQRAYGTDPLYTVSDRGRQHGPYSEADLVGLLAVGQVSRQAHVFADGWDQWFPIDSALAAAAASASPPAVATTIAVQAEYAQTNVTQTHYVHTTNIYAPTHFASHTHRKGGGGGGMIAMGITLIVVGLLGSFACPFLWLVLVPIGIICIVKASGGRG